MQLQLENDNLEESLQKPQGGTLMELENKNTSSPPFGDCSNA
jgi:hypothetical protein